MALGRGQLGSDLSPIGRLLSGLSGPHRRPGRWTQVCRRHVVVGVGAVRTGVEVEQGQRVEVSDDRSAGTVLVEDGQESE
jgi:hypothetical protein